MKEDKGMTIKEVAEYWKVDLSHWDNLIRVEFDWTEYWYMNSKTGEVVRAKDLNRK
jgi:hypothetical protein